MGYKREILDNGVRTVCETVPSTRAVSIGVWIERGSRDEDAGTAGVTHLLEHLVFKGTKTRSAYDISLELERLGGELNAFTTRETTCFHALVLSEHWEIALELLADIVTNMQITPKDFDNEKAVVLQEIASYEDMVDEKIYDLFFESCYSGQAVGREITGSIDTVTNMKLSDVKKYYEHYSNGKSIIVSAAGDIDPREFNDKVRKLFAKKKKKAVRLKRPTARWTSRLQLIDKETEQVQFLLGFPAPSFKNIDRYKALLFNTILGGGMTSILYQAVREKRGLVYQISSSQITMIDSGMIVIQAGAESAQLQKLTELVLKELKKIKRSGFTEKKIEEAKTQLIGSLILGSEDVESRMNSLGTNEMLFGRYRPIEETVAEIKKLDAKTVNRWMKKSLNLKRFCALLYGPKVKEHESWLREAINVRK